DAWMTSVGTSAGAALAGRGAGNTGGAGGEYDGPSAAVTVSLRQGGRSSDRVRSGPVARAAQAEREERPGGRLPSVRGGRCVGRRRVLRPGHRRRLRGRGPGHARPACVTGGG